MVVHEGVDHVFLLDTSRGVAEGQTVFSRFEWYTSPFCDVSKPPKTARNLGKVLEGV